jgi:uncharacterized protein with FMN-binding domain
VAGSGGKGKVSNNLVAVSCAAVLTVYTAGYWRTRDAALRFESQAQERKPVPPERPAASTMTPAAVETAVTATLPPPETPPPTVSPPMVAATAPSATAPSEPTVAAKVPSKAVDPEPQPPVASPQATLPPVVETGAMAAAVIDTVESDPATLPTPDSLPAPSGNWRDGTYTGWGTSRHGDIKAQVVIKNGRIVESSIASCETRWPCDVITSIFHQPVERQSADVDRVSRATESANAYYYALVAALDNALPLPADLTTTTR